MSKLLKVLLVEDSEDDALLILRALRRGNFEPDFERVDTSPGMRSALDRQSWDIVISDYSIPGFGGSAALELLKEKNVDLPFIIFSGVSGEHAAVEAMKAGAHDYIMKDDLTRLVPAITRELREANIRWERKQVEDKLQLMLKAIQTTQTGITITDTNGSIIFTNDAEATMHGYSAEELIGMDLGVFSPPEMRQKLPAEKIKFLAGWSRESVNIRKDGSRFPVYLNSKPVLDHDGEPVGIIATCDDITERKRAEDELNLYKGKLEALVKERTLELEEAQKELLRKERLAALGQITAIVSHDIRNPLATIRNSLFSIKEAIDHNQKERTERAIKIAERSLYRCENIITELLEFTRVKEPRLKPTEIDSWLQETVVENEIPGDFIVTCEFGSAAKIPIDRESLHRVISNVITNACQAMQEEDSPGNQLSISSYIENNKVIIRVIDTGPGISNEIIDKIFDPLYSTKSNGFGLGLPIIKTIMEQHKGGVEIESRPGEGTSVILWLRLEQPSGNVGK
jgi:PAS domain S-box-containing protein